MSNDPIVIVGAARTPMGGFQGELSGASAPELGGTAIAAALERAGLKPDDVDEVLMGCVLPAGQGQAPARQAAFHAGLPANVPSTTVNKMCGSGMKTIMIAYDQLRAGNGSVIVAGGMESMTNAPYLLPKSRAGMRMGHGQVLDHMFLDGLEDAYDKGRLMGTFAEDCAAKYNFSREAQDEFAIASLERALAAQKSGAFDAEITPVKVTDRSGQIEVNADEQPKKARPEKIPQLKPAFKKDGGTVTAANASSISDGAAALVLMRESDAKKRGLTIRARILGHRTHAQEPGWFTTAPVPAMGKLIDTLGWNGNVDLWEINEAFAVVPMAAMEELDIPHDKLNIHGGACALGHPIGASGARIIVTLLHALEPRDAQRGIASLCIGGGEGTAVAIMRE